MNKNNNTIEINLVAVVVFVVFVVAAVNIVVVALFVADPIAFSCGQTCSSEAPEGYG